MKFQLKHTFIVTLLKSNDPFMFINEEHTIKGWIRNARTQTDLCFIEVTDGSCTQPLQLILDSSSESQYDSNREIRKKIEPFLHNGTTIFATGVIVKSPATGQLIEMQLKKCEIYGKVTDSDTYLPLVKKVPLERLRESYHLRPKFKTIQAIFKIRSTLMKIIHDFFHKHGVHHLDPNIVTTSDCEGAGEVFTITTLIDKNGKVKTDSQSNVDFSDDFFRKRAFVTVSSQLGLEALCSGFGSVYTTNPSFRAEQSKTKRHLACFTHLEWELAFIDLDDLMDFSEDLVATCFDQILKQAFDELNELNSFTSKGIIDKLKSFIGSEFARISYDKAIELIHENKREIINKFPELKNTVLPVWGDDLGSHCERFICESIYKKPTFVYNYPRELKSFYMKQNAPYVYKEINKKTGHEIEIIRHTVQGCDLLIPGLGELIGSSIREDDYQTLIDEMDRRKMNKDELKWYTDLRKNATFPHGGAGLGFDRLCNVCSLMDGNIREVVPFPTSYEECDY